MLLKTAAVPGKSILGAQSCLPCNGFFFPRLAGQDRLDYSVLVLLLFGYLFQPVKTLIADDVFNTTGIGLRSPGVNACGDKPQALTPGLRRLTPAGLNTSSATRAFRG